MKCCADCHYVYEDRCTCCPDCGSTAIKSHLAPPTKRKDDLSERVKTLETALRCLLKGDKEAAKSLMEME